MKHDLVVMLTVLKALFDKVSGASAIWTDPSPPLMDICLTPFATRRLLTVKGLSLRS